MDRQHLYLENDFLGTHQSFALERYLTAQRTYPEHILFTIWRTSPLLILGEQEGQGGRRGAHAVRPGFEDTDVIAGMPGQRTMYCDQGSWQFALICKDRSLPRPEEICLGMITETLADLGIRAERTEGGDLRVAGRTVCVTDTYENNGFTVCRGVLLYGTNLFRLRRKLARAKAPVSGRAPERDSAEYGNVSDLLAHPISMLRFREELVRHFIADPSQMIRLTVDDYRVMDRIVEEERRRYRRRMPESRSDKMTHTFSVT